MGEPRRVTVRSRAEWRRWLHANHTRETSVWVVTYKKGRGRHVPYGDIVEEALAFGWVDSRPRKLDDDRSQLLVSKRKEGSRWSKANKERIEALTKAGRMTPAGRAVVDRAMQDGTWNALDSVEALEEPDDLRRALDRDAQARRNWDAFPRSTRRGILEWILSAKRAETRANRVRQTVEQATVDRRANQWRQPSR